MKSGEILHETTHRLRLAVAGHADPVALVAEVGRVTGVRSARLNAALPCLVVHHDGRAETRDAVLARLRRRVERTPRRRRTAARQPIDAAFWAPLLLAAAVPALPRAWRSGGALATVGARVLTQGDRLRTDPAAVLLDAASLSSLALSGQPMVVSTSVLLRLLAEHLSARLVRQADDLLDHLLPAEAAAYRAWPAGAAADVPWSDVPLRDLRPGDRIRLQAADVVPVDGCVIEGSARLVPALQAAGVHGVGPGAHVAAGERLHDGALVLCAEADAASSRLARLRAQVRHATGAHQPVGRLRPSFERLLSLPLTAAALVLGLTGDSARAAAMLQADPQQGLDLALPLAREAALGALARQGLLTAGLEAIERLATARSLVLQDTGVLASGRWIVESVQTQAGGDPNMVRRWLADMAATPIEALQAAGLSDKVVRLWVRHGAVLRVGEHEVHLASAQRLQSFWGLSLRGASPAADAASLRREFAVVAGGRVVATMTLTSVLRPAALNRIEALRVLGFDRIALFVEADGNEQPSRAPRADLAGLTQISDEASERGDWLANAARDGTPLLVVHTNLRDLVPPGSLSLTPMDADAGSHGVLLGDPLASLVAARRLAQAVHGRLRAHQGLATSANAVLMTSAALRWMPPLVNTLLHHGLAMALLLDSLRIESIKPAPSST